MDDLIAFLRARLDERERPLREIVRQLDAYAASDDDTGIDGGWSLWGSFGRSVDAAFNPREQLAEIETKRKMIDGLADTLANYCDDGELPLAEWMLMMLALPDAGHPDYREDWRA